MNINNSEPNPQSYPKKAKGTRCNLWMTFILLGSASLIQANTSTPNSNVAEVAQVTGTPELLKAKDKAEIVEKVTDGTVMRSGVVYALHVPMSSIDRARTFLREKRPAISTEELNELMQGLRNGEKEAIENFRKNMSKYLMDKDVGPKLVNSLNDAVLNPNKYKLNPNFAKNLLRESFEKFITLDGSKRPKTDFSKVKLEGMVIAGLDLRNTGLKASNLDIFSDWTNTNVSGLNLKDMNFENKTVSGTIFNEADLTNANFAGKSLATTSFKKATLNKANFSGSTLSNSSGSSANFNGAKARGANFARALAQRGNFQQAELDEANLEDADISGADLVGATLQNIKSNANTKTTGATFSSSTTTCNPPICPGCGFPNGDPAQHQYH